MPETASTKFGVELAGTEYQPVTELNPWEPPPVCAHCGRTIGYHWQSEEGKILCVKYA